MLVLIFLFFFFRPLKAYWPTSVVYLFSNAWMDGYFPKWNKVFQFPLILLLALHEPREWKFDIIETVALAQLPRLQRERDGTLFGVAAQTYVRYGYDTVATSSYSIQLFTIRCGIRKSVLVTVGQFRLQPDYYEVITLFYTRVHIQMNGFLNYN